MRFFRLTFKCFVDCFWISSAAGSDCDISLKFFFHLLAELKVSQRARIFKKKRKKKLWICPKSQKAKINSDFFIIFFFKKRQLEHDIQWLLLCICPPYKVPYQLAHFSKKRIIQIIRFLASTISQIIQRTFLCVFTYRPAAWIGEERR